MEEKNQTFNYIYSAKQQEEIKNIRRKYIDPQEDKMERLRKLDRQVTQKAQIWGIALGVIGSLVLGTGMSLAMTEIGAALGGLAMVLGIVIGIAGMVLVALAYPLYNRVLKKQREKIAPEILRLSDELLK